MQSEWTAAEFIIRIVDQDLVTCASFLVTSFVDTTSEMCEMHSVDDAL